MRKLTHYPVQAKYLIFEVLFFITFIPAAIYLFSDLLRLDKVLVTSVSFALIVISIGPIKKYNKTIPQRIEKRKREKIEKAKEIESIAVERATYQIKNFVWLEDCGKSMIVLNKPIDSNNKYLKVSFYGRTSLSVNSDTFYCSTDAFKGTDDKFEIKIEGKIYEYPNPYKIDFKSGLIRWQYKGHPDELYIYIPLVCMPNAEPQIKYSFRLRINRKMYGPFFGQLNEKTEQIEVKLPKLDVDCDHNACRLYPNFCDDTFAILPKPEMIFINHVKQK